jgi:hypothetical protein
MLRCSCSTVASYLGFGTLQFSGSLRVNDALYPFKSGLINKHTVKHTVKCCEKMKIMRKPSMGKGGREAACCVVNDN